MKNILFILTFFLLFSIVGCGKKSDNTDQTSSNNKNSFSWKDDLKISDIPEFPVKGYINGEEISFSYINFEKWRGTNDNVINFSTAKPEQPCGFIENFKGFQLMNKGSAITGEIIKGKFDEDTKTYTAFFKFTSSDGSPVKSASSWNCALKIDNNTDKLVSGRIALCFNDDKKSWIAGKFEAAICNN
ncbi:MAG: hypothetical protein EHM58_03495 [Ignavibacteriae bacterium]|nr:MAG: hypothetical protein EHM58_03495 [Ignavibacteriota bacterium]